MSCRKGQAQQVRSFLAALKEATAGDEKLAARTERLDKWAQRRLNWLAPVAA